MSKFHTTVSRRTFMKGLGLAGAGLGAAAATAPVFHDLDEVIAAPQSNFKRPWYIKTGLDNPTSGVDWSAKERYDYPFGPSGQTYYPGYDADERQRRRDLKAEMEKQWRLEGRPG